MGPKISFGQGEGGTGGGGGGSLTPHQETLAVTAGQPAALSTTPASAAAVLLGVNGVEAEQGVDYTISGTSLTWISGDYSLDGSDVVVAYYFS